MKMLKRVIVSIFIFIHICDVFAINNKERRKLPDVKQTKAIRQQIKESYGADKEKHEENPKYTYFLDNGINSYLMEKDEYAKVEGEKEEEKEGEEQIEDGIINKIDTENNINKKKMEISSKEKTEDDANEYNHDKNKQFSFHNEAATITQSEKNTGAKKFLDIIFSFFKSTNDHFYNLKLTEKNLRWALPIYLGSQKIQHNLLIATNTPITALYCTVNMPKKSTDEKLIYDLNISLDAHLIECKSPTCEALNTQCAPLENFIQEINNYKIKHKNCTNRLCDYVKNIKFLNMEKVTDATDVSVCSYESKLKYETLKGFYFSDSLHLKDSVKLFYNYFICISKSDNDNLNLNDVISGILGLSEFDIVKNKKHPSILNQLLKISASKKNIWGLCFVENGGIASFGGYENSLLKKKAETATVNITQSNVETRVLSSNSDMYDIIWINYSNPSVNIWKLLLKEIMLINKEGNEKTAIQQDVVLDSYDYFLALPQKFVTLLKTSIKKICDVIKSNTCTKIQDEGIMTITDKNLSVYPKIQLNFSQKLVDIEPNDYIINIGDNVYKIMVIHANEPKLGIPFFLNKYVLFDNDAKKLGVSRSQCNLEINEKDMKGFNLSDTTETTKETDASASEEKSFFQKYKIAIITLSVLGVLCVLFLIIIKCC